jgi:pimeloyl-ACP methyl ester carboxylesterase
MKLHQRISGWIVGKIAVSGQLIPIGKLRGLKLISAIFLYSQKKFHQHSVLWKDFLAKNKYYEEIDPAKAVKIVRETHAYANKKLDTVTLQSLHRNPKKHIIYGWGRHSCYEFHLARLARDALNMDAKIVTFNYGGIGYSQGTILREQDIVDDYVFQVKRLLQQGVKADDIWLHGHSMGGATAILAAAQLHQEAHKVHVFADRTYRNLIQTSMALFFHIPSSINRGIVNTALILFVTSTVTTLYFVGLISLSLAVGIGWGVIASLQFQGMQTIYNATVGRVLQTIVTWMMQQGEWHADVAKAYQSIPAEFRSHTVLRHPKKVFSETLGLKHAIHWPNHDIVIDHKFSLHEYNMEGKIKKQALKQKIKTRKAQSPLNRDLALELKTWQNELVTMSNCKMTGGGHFGDPKEMITRYPTVRSGRYINGQEYFYALVEPEGPHDLPEPVRYKVF